MATVEDAGLTPFIPMTSTSLIVTGLVVASGRAIRDEPVATPKLVTAGVIILLGMTFVNQIDPLFAATLALLILVAVFLHYGPDLLTYVGANLDGE